MSEQHLIGTRPHVVPENHGATIAWSDSKIRYVTERCRDRSVLDLGCVQHDARFAENKFWLHKAIVAVAREVIGLDLHKPGVDALQASGYNVVHGNAEDFDFGRTFEVIVAGDLIEHLGRAGSFLDRCAEHMNSTSELIICTPNPWHWHKTVRALFGPVPVNEEHTCWMCPQTLSQLAARSDLSVVHVEYGSTRWKDRFLPVSKRLRHASWYATLRKKT